MRMRFPSVSFLAWYHVPMVWDDDDDLEMFAQAEDIYRSDKGKAEQRERKARAKGMLNKLKLAQLRSNIAKDQISMKEAERTEGNDAQRKEERPAGTFGTKTHMQEEHESVTTADEKAKDEKLMAQQKAQEDARRQSGVEEQKEPG